MELSPHLLFHVDDRGSVLQEQRPERDLDGKILLWNEGARRMYGYEAEEVVGQTKLRGSRGSDLTNSMASRNGSQALADGIRLGFSTSSPVDSTPNPVVTSLALAGFEVAFPFEESFSRLRLGLMA
jgi:hypothetical protein